MSIRVIVFVALLASLVAFGAPVAAQNNCTFTAGPEPAPLYDAPLADPGQQSDLLEAGTSVPVISRSGLQVDALYLVAVDHAYGGWVDPRSGHLSGSCEAVPLDTTPHINYPSICTLTAAARVPFFNEAALTVSQGALDPGVYVVTRRSGGALLVRLDHAMAGYVAANAGALSAACETLPAEHSPLGTAGPNARLWSAPDVRSGRVLASLPAGTRVIILAGPVAGPIRTDTPALGDWYQVQASGSAVGWIWSDRLTFDASLPPPTAPPAGTAMANARLWSAPNVHAGQVVAFLDAGTRLHILTGPVRGPIRYDTADEGDWYYVQPVADSYAGWIWVGRLASN